MNFVICVGPFLGCTNQNVVTVSKSDSESVQIRFDTVVLCSTCHVLGMIPYQHVLVYVSDPETRIQMQGVCSGNGGNTGKEGGNREVR